MANRKLSERQSMQLDSERSMEVYKRNDMIQQARFSLSVQEQKTVLYAISKIKPDDTYLTEYTFDIKDFYRIIGWNKESYTEFKAMLKGLTDKSWWATIDDKGTESVLRWFTTARSNKRSGKVTVKFHEDMMPYLLQLAEQQAFYTSYNLRYVLPMSSQYSPRLYELLKSYQKNNREWFFEIDELKRLLDCQNYKNFNDFKKRALNPAVEEINKYTDINIAYDTEREGRKITRVIFYMAGKSKDALLKAQLEGSEALDGQLDIFEVLQDCQNSVRTQFWRENNPRKTERGDDQ